MSGDEVEARAEGSIDGGTSEIFSNMSSANMLSSMLSKIINQKLPIFNSSPRCKIHFITIKDNAQSPKWRKIDTVKTWLRRYYNHWILVKSPEGGFHFHALAVLNRPPESVRTLRGIHFHIKPLGKQVHKKVNKMKYLMKYICFDDACMRDELCSEIRRVTKRKKGLCSNYDLSLLAEKKRDISGCIAYLYKNLNENPYGSEKYDVIHIK